MRSELPIPRWLRSPHLQTIVPSLPLHARPAGYASRPTERIRVPVAGGHVHAHAWWADTPRVQLPRMPRVAVVIVHGIAGSSASHCCVRAAVALHREGYHVLRMDLRGAGESIPDAPSLYSAGLTTDVDAVVRHVAKDPRVSGVAVLGFSGGGSVALKLAGEWGTKAPRAVRAIATVSAPLDYPRVAARMDTWVCLPYRYHVLRKLVDTARAFAAAHPSRARFAESDLAAIRRFRAFDANVIAPMHGHSDVDRYYAEASSGPWLGRVDVPTLLVHAEDDPMVPGETVRPWLAGASAAVRAELTPHGGHIGWLGGLDEASWVTTWPARRVLDFFARHAPAARTLPVALA